MAPSHAIDGHHRSSTCGACCTFHATTTEHCGLTERPTPTSPLAKRGLNITMAWPSASPAQHGQFKLLGVGAERGGGATAGLPPCTPMPAMLATPPRSLQAQCTACRLSNGNLATNELTFGDADGVIRSLRVRGR